MTAFLANISCSLGKRLPYHESIISHEFNKCKYLIIIFVHYCCYVQIQQLILYKIANY
jgi:hypothetical protein